MGAYEKIRSRVHGVKENGCRDHFVAICPNHPDKKQSLDVKKVSFGALCHCFAGCMNEDIMASIGLKLSDLYDSERLDAYKSMLNYYSKKFGSGIYIADEYQYHNDKREYLYSKIRFEGGQIDGKEIIYCKIDRTSGRWKAGKGNNGKVLYRLPDLIRYRDSEPYVIYVEGEKDVETLLKNGFKAVTTSGGTEDWKKDFAKEFSGINLVILRDNDEPGKRHAYKVAEDSLSIAKTVKIVNPSKLDKGDVTDYLTKEHGTVEDLRKLIDSAEIMTKTDSTSSEDDSNSNSEHRDKDKFHTFNKSGEPSGVNDYAILEWFKSKEIYVMAGTWLIYENGIFNRDETGAYVKTLIRELLYPEFVKSTTIDRVYRLILFARELHIKYEDMNQYPCHWIPFINGFYDPIEKKMIDHDPKYRCVYQIPHEYKPNDNPSGDVTEAFLKASLEDEQDREMLFQFIGYSMTRDTRQQKMIIFEGVGGTGKSTTINMVEEVDGAENISNISLGEFTQRFASYGLFGKVLNTCADLEISALEDTSILKKILGEDTLRAEAKGKDAFSFKNFAKLMFSTNELPVIKSERSNGFYRRLLILVMNKVPDKVDTDLLSKLKTEIDYWLHQSVEALSRMYQTGRIFESESSKKAVNQLRCDSDTVEAFLNIYIIRDGNGRIKRSELYRYYENFCNDEDRMALKRKAFFASIRAKGFSEIKYNGLDCFKGMAFNTDSIEQYQKSIILDREQLNNDIPF